MADDAIPQDLIDLQRAFDAARAVTRTAAGAGEDLAGPMAAERAAQRELADARDAAGLGGWPDAQRIMEAARAASE